MVSFAFFPPASALSADDSAVCESAEAASEATEPLCASGCGGCQSHVLILTEAEIRLLRRFGELAFLPAACTRTNETPVYLSDLGGRAEISAAILALQVKRLISVDFALPLQGFDYAEYEDYPVRGSMALTAAGQEALDSLNIQGCGE